MTTPLKKAFNPYVQVLTDSYSGYVSELVVTSGDRALGLKMRYRTEFDGVNTTMTPEQARALAADLIARADEIEAEQDPKTKICGCIYTLVAPIFGMIQCTLPADHRGPHKRSGAVTVEDSHG